MIWNTELRLVQSVCVLTEHLRFIADIYSYKVSVVLNVLWTFFLTVERWTPNGLEVTFNPSQTDEAGTAASLRLWLMPLFFVGTHT